MTENDENKHDRWKGKVKGCGRVGKPGMRTARKVFATIGNSGKKIAKEVGEKTDGRNDRGKKEGHK